MGLMSWLPRSARAWGGPSLRAVVDSLWQDRVDYPGVNFPAPDIPDNPAGTTYIQVEWATVAGWGGWSGSPTLSVDSGLLHVVSPGAASQIYRTIKSWTGNRTLIVRAKKSTPGTLLLAGTNGSTSFPIGTISDGWTTISVVLGNLTPNIYLIITATSPTDGNANYDLDTIYLGNGSSLPRIVKSGAIYRLVDFLEGIVRNSRPATADILADQWAQEAPMYTSRGGQSVGYLQAQISARWPGVSLSQLTFDLANQLGVAECGIARCSDAVGLGPAYPVAYVYIVGSVDNRVKFNALQAFLVRVLPAHMSPIFQITVTNENATSMTGLAESGVAQLGT